MKDLILYPHKTCPGYFIDFNNLDVYSIKSGVLKKMKTSTWRGETYVALSHKGERKHFIVDFLGSSIDYTPQNTLKLDIQLPGDRL